MRKRIVCVSVCLWRRFVYGWARAIGYWQKQEVFVCDWVWYDGVMLDSCTYLM